MKQADIHKKAHKLGESKVETSRKVLCSMTPTSQEMNKRMEVMMYDLEKVSIFNNN